MESQSQLRFVQSSGVGPFVPVLLLFLVDFAVGADRATQISGGVLFLLQSGLLTLYYKARRLNPLAYSMLLLPLVAWLILLGVTSEGSTRWFPQGLVFISYAGILLLLTDGAITDGAIEIGKGGLVLTRGWRRVRIDRSHVDSVQPTQPRFPVLLAIPRLTQFTIQTSRKERWLGLPFQPLFDRRVRLLVPSEEVDRLESALAEHGFPGATGLGSGSTS